MKYAIYNNKGGVGKTFLSFVLSTEMANNSSNKDIIVIDMCPQANISEIILGGSGFGGTEKLDDLINQRFTIGGYFDERISSPNHVTGQEKKYLLQTNKFNQNMPSNLWLIAGDPSLEIQAQAISQISGQTLPLEVWKNVHYWVKDLISECSKELSKDVTVFIDCNPSFSIYTELAMSAAQRVIVPCTSDDSSGRAINNIGALLFGIGVGSAYNTVNFSGRAREFKMTLPKIHSIVFNRSTEYDKKASKAFGAMFNSIREKVENLKNKADDDAFENELNYEQIPDSHSVTIVCSHLGKPLYSMKPGKYEVYDKKPQINSDPLNRYKTAVKELLIKI